MYNYYQIESLWLKTGKIYAEEIWETTIDISHFIKVWDLIPWDWKNLITESRKILLIEHSMQ
jgi:hypothetical protein